MQGWKGQRGPLWPPTHSSLVSLQLLGFFKGMSFPIASIAVVNSVLFGIYSNTLLALTATSHQERRAQPPSYTHIFIAGCTGGFLQVRRHPGGARVHTHMDAMMVSSLFFFPAPSGDPQLQAPGLPQAEDQELWGSGQLLAGPDDLARLSSGPPGCRPGAEGHGEQRRQRQRAQGRGGEGDKRTHGEAANTPV